MPPRSPERRIRDILAAIGKIRRYTSGSTFADFAADERTIDAVIRNLGVIGEAANHLPDEYIARHDGIPWAEMRGMRNVVIHEYSVSVWRSSGRRSSTISPRSTKPCAPCSGRTRAQIEK